MSILKYFSLPLFLIGSLLAQDTAQTFLSLRNTGVKKFQKEHPEYDGRGTIILILDTGVDMGVEGLTETTTGEVKVIDVQDFTGQGDTPYYEAEIEDINDKMFFINEERGLKVAGATKLEYLASNDQYYLGVLNESLWKNSGSEADDINGNGSKDDTFHFVTFKVEQEAEEFWVVFLDIDADGDLSDERPLRNYNEKFDAFTFPNELGLPKFTMGLNIFPGQQIVSFYFDDGSHGTHCAGISAGNQIGNNELFGVAPGAYLIGLKLGNNNLAGGATVSESMKKAILYADKLSKEKSEPCIINLSFGIGSETEGHGDIEKFIDKTVDENPYLYIAKSAGNDGPGLSTIGMPSTPRSVFSSGAVLSQEVGNDLYGTTLDKDIILHFSSRGAEVSKPDVVAPGACVSTVPNFSSNDIFWGTSMSSPYSAGVMSVLLGAINVEYPGVKIPAKMLYKVLRESAILMEGYNFLDQGGGLINIERAYKLLKKYIDSGEVNKFETYTVKSLAANMPYGSAPNLYIRDASYLSGSETFAFNVKRDNLINQDKFYRLYNLKSSADWLKLIKRKVHLRNQQAVTIYTQIDKTILEKPGLYNAKIEASRADMSKTPEFDLMATICVPYLFNNENNYSLSFGKEKIKPGNHKRYYLKIPYGTSNLNIKLTSSKSDYTSIRYYLHDTDGKEKLYGKIKHISDDGVKHEYVQDLTPGVYEFVVLGEFTSNEESIYGLDFGIDGVNIVSDVIENNKINVVNYFPEIKTYNLKGKLLGYKKTSTIKMDRKDKYTIEFNLNTGESQKTFEISLSKDDFNKITDCAFMIYDENGKAQKTGGLSYKDGEITIKKLFGDIIEKYKLVIIPGFAEKPGTLEITLSEKTYFDEVSEIQVTSSHSNSITMYPDIVYPLNCFYDLKDYTIQTGHNYFGEIVFTSKKTKDVELTKIIQINN